MNKRIVQFYLVFFVGCCAMAQQSGTIHGLVSSPEGPLVQATILVVDTDFGAVADFEGRFTIRNLPAGDYKLQIRAVGYATTTADVTVEAGKTTVVERMINEDRFGLNEVVVSSSRYELSKEDAPSLVSVVGSKLLQATQSLSMVEGLSYQPGVRVEANCQNCGFTQLRMNGLEGPYSQILVNSRPIFSTLTGVYGLEMIPANVIERVEVVRSGGSALYGSNAIAGTVNVITKDPVENNWQIGSNIGLLRGEVPDQSTNFNASVVSEDLNSGVTFYGMRRDREGFDADGDGFTELVSLNNLTFGAKAFFKASEYSKLTLDINAIEEFRRGGDQLDLAPHLADIAEQLDHSILNAGLTYDRFSKDKRTKVSTYGSMLTGTRRSYYGGLGGERTLADSLAATNAYGLTDDFAGVLGSQITHNFNGSTTFVAGMEYQGNAVEDEISGYEKLIDQRVNTGGFYGQFECKTSDKLTVFMGTRYDLVGVDGMYEIGEISREVDFNRGVLSPRFTLLYDLLPEAQLRAGYARGFRAPQAFDEDLHISSVDGEQKFVVLAEDLAMETSDAYTLSLNMGNNTGLVQSNFLVEGFYTNLYNQFQRVNLGQMENGAFLEETRNGSGATVSGINVEYAISPSSRYSFQVGGTLQQALYSEDEVLFEPEEGSTEFPAITVSEFIRTPNAYGFLNASWTPNKVFGLDITGLYTGPMLVPLLVNEEEFIELTESPAFLDVNIRLSYRWMLANRFTLEVSGGVQNIFDSYQEAFDTGPTRDADFVYGPLRPRTFFLGIKIGNFL
ncbi:TonB-dependent receptor [Cyclobacterium xiamenense]|uniref:TonB-dependent receptor n=1 Tax=Cyclobacterium xiamenense TaxID=1297121 RepID=UPI0012B969E9|nr:TonB-dependent receptor [Cyclobacterium xiamenense]